MKSTSFIIAAILFTFTATSQDLIVDGKAVINKIDGLGQALEVFTHSGLAGKFTSSDPGATIVEIENTSINGDSWSLIVDGNGRFYIDETQVAPRMTFETGGHIGIGLTDPNDALDVVGDIDATGCVQTDDTGTIGGACLSDRRLKKNISKLDEQLGSVLNLRPVRFDWKDPSNGQTGQIGLIAQDVEDVIPEMVTTDEHGNKRIRYDISLQIRMIKALQEQQEMITSYQSEVGILRKELNEIKSILAKNSVVQTTED